MKISVGSDHAGFLLKSRLVELLTSQGYEVDDHGTFSEESVDYPDFAKEVASDVGSGKASRGLLVCGSGVGMSIAANKVHGVRAANVATPEEAEVSRRHNDANILCLGERFIAPELADEILKTWLKTGFDGGRHLRRVEKIVRLEDEDAREHVDDDLKKALAAVEADAAGAPPSGD